MPVPADYEARLQAIVDTAVCGVITIDTSGIIETVNPACEDLFGYRHGELVGQNVTILMQSPDRGKHGSYIKRYLDTGDRKIIGIGREVVACRKDGSSFPALLSVSEFRVDGKRMFTGILDDVTDLKRAEGELENRVRQQEVVAELGVLALAGADMDELMGEAVLRVAKTLRVDYVKILELSPDGGDLLLRAGTGWREGLVGEAIIDASRESQAGFTLANEGAVIVGDLSRESRFSAPPLLTEHGIVSSMSVVVLGEHRPFGVFGAHSAAYRAFRDVDAHFLQSVANVVAEAIRRKSAEQQLIEQENLVQLGEMAGVVAHEVKNTQAGVSGALRIIRARLPEESGDREVISDMLKRLESLNQFMGDVLTFARPRMTAFSELPVKLLLEDTVSVVSENPRFRDIGIMIGADDLTISLDPQVLRPVLVNLLVNAAESIDGQGSVSIEAREYHEPSCPGCCRISVTDTGQGMLDHERERAFEPFFSTKHRGSGLGLSIAKRVVELHGGRVAIVCPEEGGTRVVLDLPLTTDA